MIVDVGNDSCMKLSSICDSKRKHHDYYIDICKKLSSRIVVKSMLRDFDRHKNKFDHHIAFRMGK